MIGLTVRLARGLNRLWRRIGSVFADRFHSRILTTPTAVRTALVYVLGNARKHGAWRAKRPDDYSSAATFDGWLVRPRNPAESSAGPIARARTWLLAKGWKRLGLLHPLDAPAASSPPRRWITRRVHRTLA